MRKLATIQRVLSLNPIPDADAIEVAQVLGWKVVVKKGEFNVNDLVVYCEIDSLMPERPEFEFLRNSKFRIRTVKLRGQVSQGICFPLSILKQGDWDFGVRDMPIGEAAIACIRNTKTDLFCGGIKLVEGADVTEVLGITKYEAPIPAELAGNVKRALPSYFQVTDEDRIQILPHIPEQYGGQRFIATEKLDGSSCSFYWRNGEFGVCGRNWEYYESPTNSIWKFAKQNNIEEKLGDLGRNIALQGEIIGEGIQGNKYKLKGQTVRFFRAFDIDKYQYLPYDEFFELIENKLGLRCVPILDWEYVLPSTIDEILAYAQGNSVLNPLIGREGVVFVRFDENYQGRLSFKAISNKFLIDNKE
jgi:RNA ligase (TIGR02306 family)